MIRPMTLIAMLGVATSLAIGVSDAQAKKKRSCVVNVHASARCTDAKTGGRCGQITLVLFKQDGFGSAVRKSKAQDRACADGRKRGLLRAKREHPISWVKKRVCASSRGKVYDQFVYRFQTRFDRETSQPIPGAGRPLVCR